MNAAMKILDCSQGPQPEDSPSQSIDRRHPTDIISMIMVYYSLTALYERLGTDCELRRDYILLG